MFKEAALSLSLDFSSQELGLCFLKLDMVLICRLGFKKVPGVVQVFLKVLQATYPVGFVV